ncbi:MAG: HEAT repeat domain-containing protein [Aulosira sp. DedQUE10]|nr:HEAT repeat domain-containing protein [Aulosira sp. DedQUE10]
MVSVSALGKIGSLTAISAIHQALNNQDLIVRIAAVSALDKIGNEAVVPILVESLQDSDSSVREKAVDALGEIGSEKAISSLQKTLNDTEYSVVWRVANALKLIQERCKFYNYEIFQSSPLIEATNTDNPTINSHTINNINYNLQGSNISNVAHSVYGNQQTLSVKPNEDSQPT